MTKAEKIRQTRSEKLERHPQQMPFVVEAKLCPHSLTTDQKESLPAYFREACWLWNWVVADTKSRLNNTPWKVKEVEVKVGDHNAARNMIRSGLSLADSSAGTVSVTPVERMTASVTIGSNPYVTLNRLYEVGIA
jgi:hypothetical protein